VARRLNVELIIVAVVGCLRPLGLDEEEERYPSAPSRVPLTINSNFGVNNS
jgi:hypothetical protein